MSTRAIAALFLAPRTHLSVVFSLQSSEILLSLALRQLKDGFVGKKLAWYAADSVITGKDASESSKSRSECVSSSNFQLGSTLVSEKTVLERMRRLFFGIVGHFWTSIAL